MEPTKAALDCGVYLIVDREDREICIHIGGAVYIHAFLPEGVEVKIGDAVHMKLEVDLAKP